MKLTRQKLKEIIKEEIIQENLDSYVRFPAIVQYLRQTKVAKTDEEFEAAAAELRQHEKYVRNFMRELERVMGG